HQGVAGRVLADRRLAGPARAGRACETRAVPASRSYDRAPADIRPVTIDPGFVRTADGSALISIGETRVICTASVSASVPRWLEGSSRGWGTAEYARPPPSTG